MIYGILSRYKQSYLRLFFLSCLDLVSFVLYIYYFLEYNIYKLVFQYNLFVQ